MLQAMPSPDQIEPAPEIPRQIVHVPLQACIAFLASLAARVGVLGHVIDPDRNMAVSGKDLQSIPRASADVQDTALRCQRRFDDLCPDRINDPTMMLGLGFTTRRGADQFRQPFICRHGYWPPES